MSGSTNINKKPMGIPRKISIELCTPAEKSIYEAMQEVEKTEQIYTLFENHIKNIEEDEKTFGKSNMYVQLIEAKAAKIALLKLKIEIQKL